MYKTGFQILTKFTLQTLRNIRRSVNFSTMVETMEKDTFSPSERLSPSVRPLNYKLHLEPDLATGESFKGNIVIKVNVEEKKNSISLHANLLEITDVKVFKEDKIAVPVAKFNLIPKVEQLQIDLAELIDKGIYNINVDFTGKLTGFLGLYSTSTKADR